MSQHELGDKVGIQHGMIGSYERDEFYPTIDSLNKLSSVLDINILCCEGYSKLLLKPDDFKNKLIKWRKEKNLTKRDASRLLNISERGYASWENGVIMNSTTYRKVKRNLAKYDLGL